MIAYIVRRLIGAVVLLFVITFVTFLIFFGMPRLAGVSADDLAGRFAGKTPDKETLQQIKEQFGFDQSIFEQYGTFIGTLVGGGEFDTGTEMIDCPAPCLGFSYRTNENVLDEVLDRLPVSLSLVLGAAAIWLISGVAIGITSALRRGKLVDRISMAIALAGVSLPIFFTGLLSLYFIVHQLEWLPPVKFTPIEEDVGAWAEGLILPWITLAFLFSAMYARLTRAGMLDTLGEDYIRTARAKGLRERTVIGKHALRSTMTPVLTIFGLDIGLALSGTVLTEKTFSLKGIGSLSLDGVNKSDLPVVLGVVVFAALFIVIANLIVDLMYGVLDPTVRK